MKQRSLKMKSLNPDGVVLAVNEEIIMVQK